MGFVWQGLGGKGYSCPKLPEASPMSNGSSASPGQPRCQPGQSPSAMVAAAQGLTVTKRKKSAQL